MINLNKLSATAKRFFECVFCVVGIMGLSIFGVAMTALFVALIFGIFIAIPLAIVIGVVMIFI